MTRIPEGLGKRDYHLIEYYNKWIAAASEVSKEEISYQFYHGSQWPDKAALAKGRLNAAKVQEQFALDELLKYANMKDLQ